MPDVRLPSAWERTSLAGLAEYLNGFAFNESYWSAEGLPIVRIAQITGSQGIVDRYQGPLPDTYRLDDGDLIFSWSGTLAVVRWNGGPAWLNQHLFKVVPRHGIDRDLLFHLLQASVVEMNKRTHGSTMKHIKRGELREFSVSLPVDAAEQRALAEILDTLDTTIRQTEAIIEKLKQVKQGLLHDLLTRGIDANGELRPPQSQAPHLYKDSPLGWIPREWRALALSELARVRSGTTPARSAASRYFSGGVVPWVKTLDLNEGVILSTDERVTDAALRECSCERLPVGTVLIAMYGGWEQIGRTAMLGVAATTNQAISALLLDAAELEPEYILRAVQHGRPRWASVAASTRKDPNITKADVASFQIPVPRDRHEQARVVEMVRASLRRIESERLTLSKLQRQKSGLMDDLLTGRVRVTPLLPAAAA
jgi:type I restriction enzyme S subunit